MQAVFQSIFDEIQWLLGVYFSKSVILTCIFYSKEIIDRYKTIPPSVNQNLLESNARIQKVDPQLRVLFASGRNRDGAGSIAP